MKCGFCMYFCPVYREIHTEPIVARGRNVLAAELLDGNTYDWKHLEERFSKCLTCNRCAQFCPAKVEVATITMAARGDIVANKKTFLLINALTLAKGEMRANLTDWLNKEDYDRQEKIKAVTVIYNKLHIKELTRIKIKELFRDAMLSLDRVSVSKERKKVLETFAQQLMNREK